jgi:group II intron reverse transcriptase/maturase
VDADIRGYFNHVDHEWLMKFIEHRITDGKILRNIKRMLKAGVMEAGEYQKTEAGVPQGGSISPLLANIYLHYVLDLWFEKVVIKTCKGEACLTRYADDFVACFQYEQDARRYYEQLKQRLAKFGLEIAEEKTRIIEFGRYAAQNAKRQGKRKPETFEFLGFTHYMGKTRKKGRYKLKWKTSRKRLTKKVKEVGKWLKENRHRSIPELWEEVNQKLRGHYQYYGVSDNSKALYTYRWLVVGLLYKWLNRRSQRNNLNWKKFKQLQKHYPLAKPKKLFDLNPMFARRGSCGEPDALTGQVRF